MKKIFILLFFLITTSYLSAQNYYGKSLDISVGYTQEGFGIEGGYNYKFNELDKLTINALATFSGEDIERFRLLYNIYKIKGSYFREIISNRRGGIKINLGGGLLAGYENINLKNDNNLNEVELKQDSGFIYGISVATEVDFFITRVSSMVLKASQEFHINSDLGKFIPYISIGYRYKL